MCFGLVGQVSSLNWANGEEGMLTQTSAHLGWSLSYMRGPGWNNWADAALSTVPSSSRLRQAHKQSRNRNAVCFEDSICITFGLIGPRKSLGQACNQMERYHRAKGMDTGRPLMQSVYYKS